MQGVIVTPSGDVWVLGIEKRQLVRFPKGDLTKGKIVCEGDSGEPCKSFLGPFHLGIDQQDRIWVANSGADHVTRFPASDPSKTENFKTGINNSGLGIDRVVWASTARGTCGSPTDSALAYWAWPT
jgi:streptogramin lyase